MNHGVAIRANWDEILDWINYIVFTDLAEGRQVMDMDETPTEFTVLLPEVYCTNSTGSTVMPDALVTGVSIAFVTIHKHLGSLALFELGARNILVGEDGCFFDFLGAEGPINSRRAFNRTMGYRMTDTRKCEGSTIFASVKHKNSILARYEILNRLLSEMGLILPMPD